MAWAMGRIEHGRPRRVAARVRIVYRDTRTGAESEIVADYCVSCPSADLLARLSVPDGRVYLASAEAEAPAEAGAAAEAEASREHPASLGWDNRAAGGEGIGLSSVSPVVS